MQLELAPAVDGEVGGQRLGGPGENPVLGLETGEVERRLPDELLNGEDDPVRAALADSAGAEGEDGYRYDPLALSINSLEAARLSAASLALLRVYWYV